MDRRADKRKDEQKSPHVLQDFVPFRAAAQKGEKDDSKFRAQFTVIGLVLSQLVASIPVFKVLLDLFLFIMTLALSHY